MLLVKSRQDRSRGLASVAFFSPWLHHNSMKCYNLWANEVKCGTVRIDLNDVSNCNQRKAPCMYQCGYSIVCIIVWLVDFFRHTSLKKTAHVDHI